GGRAFARDVSKHKSETTISIRKKIVEVAAEFASWNIRGRNVESRNFTRASRQKLALDFASRVEFTEKPLFVAARLFVHTRVFKSNRNERGKRSEQPLMLRGKRVRLCGFEIQHTDQTVPQK